MVANFEQNCTKIVRELGRLDHLKAQNLLVCQLSDQIVEYIPFQFIPAFNHVLHHLQPFYVLVARTFPHRSRMHHLNSSACVRFALQ